MIYLHRMADPGRGAAGAWPSRRRPDRDRSPSRRFRDPAVRRRLEDGTTVTASAVVARPAERAAALAHGERHPGATRLVGGVDPGACGLPRRRPLDRLPRPARDLRARHRSAALPVRALGGGPPRPRRRRDHPCRSLRRICAEASAAGTSASSMASSTWSSRDGAASWSVRRFLPRPGRDERDRRRRAAGGLPGRPRPEVPEAPGLYLAGDWVGSEGMLADASLASARSAARAILAEAASRERRRLTVGCRCRRARHAGAVATCSRSTALPLEPLLPADGYAADADDLVQETFVRALHPSARATASAVAAVAGPGRPQPGARPAPAAAPARLRRAVAAVAGRRRSRPRTSRRTTVPTPPPATTRRERVVRLPARARGAHSDPAGGDALARRLRLLGPRDRRGARRSRRPTRRRPTCARGGRWRPTRLPGGRRPGAPGPGARRPRALPHLRRHGRRGGRWRRCWPTTSARTATPAASSTPTLSRFRTQEGRRVVPRRRRGGGRLRDAPPERCPPPAASALPARRSRRRLRSRRPAIVEEARQRRCPILACGDGSHGWLTPATMRGEALPNSHRRARDGPVCHGSRAPVDGSPPPPPTSSDAARRRPAPPAVPLPARSAARTKAAPGPCSRSAARPLGGPGLSGLRSECPCHGCDSRSRATPLPPASSPTRDDGNEVIVALPSV